MSTSSYCWFVLRHEVNVINTIISPGTRERPRTVVRGQSDHSLSGTVRNPILSCTQQLPGALNANDTPFTSPLSEKPERSSVLLGAPTTSRLYVAVVEVVLSSVELTVRVTGLPLASAKFTTAPAGVTRTWQVPVSGVSVGLTATQADTATESIRVMFRSPESHVRRISHGPVPDSCGSVMGWSVMESPAATGVRWIWVDSPEVATAVNVK